jgi:hypothetical protein
VVDRRQFGGAHGDGDGEGRASRRNVKLRQGVAEVTGRRARAPRGSRKIFQVTHFGGAATEGVTEVSVALDSEWKL